MATPHAKWLVFGMLLPIFVMDLDALIATASLAGTYAALKHKWVEPLVIVAEEAPRIMKAVRYHKYGAPLEVAQLETNVPVPAIQENQVLIRVMAAALNPIDVKKMDGELHLVDRMIGGDLEKNGFIPGSDFAGLVVSRGSAVTRLNVGDAVYGMKNWLPLGSGTLADYVAVREDLVAHKPASLTFVEAAALPLAGLTVLQALRDHARVGAGDNLILYGAGGGTGTLAVQVARALGVNRIVATAGPSSLRKVKKLGATSVIDYTNGDVAGKQLLESVSLHHGGQRDGAVTSAATVALDCVGGTDVWDSARALLQPSGRFVTIAFDTPLRDMLTLRGAAKLTAVSAQRMLKHLLGAGPRHMSFRVSPGVTDLDTLSDLVNAGKLKPIIDRVMPFSKTSEALSYVAAGHAHGKVVVEMSPHAAARTLNLELVHRTSSTDSTDIGLIDGTADTSNHAAGKETGTTTKRATSHHKKNSVGIPSIEKKNTATASDTTASAVEKQKNGRKQHRVSAHVVPSSSGGEDLATNKL